MAVHCADCGEELLGSVNRCWRCGKEFASRTGDREVPPVRRPPVVGPLEGPLEALVIEDRDAAERAPAAAGEPAVREATVGPDRWQRRGSPFAQPLEAEGAPSADSPSTAGGLPKPGGDAVAVGAGGGAAAAIVLACISFAVAFVVPLAALILAIFGLGFGTWGLKARRRAAAIIGLLLCCLAFGLAGFLLSVETYTSYYGYTPWETFDPTLGP